MRPLKKIARHGVRAKRFAKTKNSKLGLVSAKSFDLKLSPPRVFSLVIIGLAMLINLFFVGSAIPTFKQLNIGQKNLVLGSEVQRDDTTTKQKRSSAVLLEDAALKAIDSQILDRAKLTNDSEPTTEVVQDKMAYRISGEKIHKFLGFINLSWPRIAWVATNDGRVIGQEQSLLAGFVESLSF